MEEEGFSINIAVDLHCHTNVSNHAFSTVKECAESAALKGLEGFAVTNHGPKSADGAHRYHFNNMRVIPRKIHGVTVLRGAEGNILSADGNIDLTEDWMNYLDVVIASIHQNEYKPKSADEHTAVLLNVINNPLVRIMGHMDREGTEFDIERVVKRAVETNTIIEINATSLRWSKVRPSVQIRDIALACNKLNCMVAVNSDAHYCDDVGVVELAIELLKDINFNEDLIINTSLRKVVEILHIKL